MEIKIKDEDLFLGGCVASWFLSFVLVIIYSIIQQRGYVGWFLLLSAIGVIAYLFHSSVEVIE